ncbi:MAG: hypothetical protein WB870_15625 [Gallionellaceae bacterium]
MSFIEDILHDQFVSIPNQQGPVKSQTNFVGWQNPSVVGDARCLRRLKIAGFSQKLTPIKSVTNGRAGINLKLFFDNYGSGYINYKVARLLEKLCIEFTKSRPRHSNDNALAESKNGAVAR